MHEARVPLSHYKLTWCAGFKHNATLLDNRHLLKVDICITSSMSVYNSISITACVVLMCRYRRMCFPITMNKLSQGSDGVGGGRAPGGQGGKERHGSPADDGSSRVDAAETTLVQSGFNDQIQQHVPITWPDLGQNRMLVYAKAERWI